MRRDHAQVRFQPTVDLSIGIRDAKIEHFDANAKGTLEASFALTVDTKTSIDIDRNRAYRDALKERFRMPPISFTLFETEPYTLPVQWIGESTDGERLAVMLDRDSAFAAAVAHELEPVSVH